MILVSVGLAFNVAFRKALANADTSNATMTGLDIYVGVRPPLPAGATIDVPMVRRGAWDAALSTSALRLIVYDPANRVVTIRQATQWWNEISFLQKLQVDVYKQYLPAIRAAATH